MDRMEAIQQLNPLGPYGEAERAEAIRHLDHDIGIYLPGEPRYICSILGAVHQEVRETRPDLAELVAEATWLAMRMNAALRDRKTPTTIEAQG